MGLGRGGSHGARTFDLVSLRPVPKPTPGLRAQVTVGGKDGFPQAPPLASPSPGVNKRTHSLWPIEGANRVGAGSYKPSPGPFPPPLNALSALGAQTEPRPQSREPRSPCARRARWPGCKWHGLWDQHVPRGPSGCLDRSIFMAASMEKTMRKKYSSFSCGARQSHRGSPTSAPGSTALRPVLGIPHRQLPPSLPPPPPVGGPSPGGLRYVVFLLPLCLLSLSLAGNATYTSVWFISYLSHYSIDFMRCGGFCYFF